MQRYSLIEVGVNQPDLPPWSVTWPGEGGCGTHSVYFGVATVFSDPPDYGVDNYEPYYETENRSQTHNSGRRPGYPPFRYTPYHVSKSTIKRFLVKRLNAGTGSNRFKQYGVVTRVGGT